MLNLPPISTLQPRCSTLHSGAGLHVFHSSATPLLKLDLLFEAGSAYQPVPLCAAAANKLVTASTSSMDSAALSHFLDYRGVIVDAQSDVQQTVISVYMLRRYADDVVPLLGDMLRDVAFSETDFSVWRSKRRTELATYRERSSFQARRLFYQSLFGPSHPLGRYASPDDADSLTVESVRSYARSHYSCGPHTIVASGMVDDSLVALLDRTFGTSSRPEAPSLPPFPSHAPAVNSFALKDSVQTSIRVGRILPLQWTHPDYAPFLILATLLGGYFGSRLMSNLREDKGYTYGIYARTQIYRGIIVFSASADVAAGTADDSVKQVLHEMEILGSQKVTVEELEMVKNVFVGDFLRSVDGIFELSSRHCDMLATQVDEGFTENLSHAIASVTPDDIMRLAARYLAPADMTVSTAGA